MESYYSLSEEKRLRFKIRRGDLEVELEGDFEYVRSQYEKFSDKLDLQTFPLQEAQTPDIVGSRPSTS